MQSRRRFLATTAALAFMPAGCATVTAPTRASDPRFPNRLVVPTRIYGRDDYPALYRPAESPSATSVRYPGFRQETIVLKKGTLRRPGALPLPCDILLERDVEVTMRDGTIIYADVLRPTGDGRRPAIMLWSPYGKEISESSLDDVANRAGVPLSKLSGLQKFEGLDPAYWVLHGYAIVHPDPRGAYKSHGNISCWGRQTAEDGYDVIEWIAAQPWSSGKIGMAGNSWLCISQWFIASERPPHLAAFAPWEGFTDAYRDSMVRGGIPSPFTRDTVLQNLGGEGLIEDVCAMAITNPLLDEYWADKIARLERIDAPAYVVASFTNGAHARGGFDGYRRISSKQKWLRVHNTHEWPDLYVDENVEDLRRFFDHFLSAADNGWPATPPVRLSVLDPGGTDIVGRVEREFPLARAQYRKLYLTALPSLDWQAPAAAGATTHAARENAGQRFAIRFDRETEITGTTSLTLWVEADGSDDMDLWISVQKLDKAGKPVTESLSYPKPLNPIVATGVQRASMRALDTARSTDAEPVLSFKHEQKLAPGQVVTLRIPLWSMAIRFHAGESLELTVRPHNPVDRRFADMGRTPIPVPVGVFTYPPDQVPEMRMLGGDRSQRTLSYAVGSPPSRNAGTHILHMGGDRASHLLVPLIPS